MRCKNCGRGLRHVLEKAVAEPRDHAWQMVWMDIQGDWICYKTGDEHEPEEGEMTKRAAVLHGSEPDLGDKVYVDFGDSVTDGDEITGRVTKINEETIEIDGDEHRYDEMVHLEVTETYDGADTYQWETTTPAEVWRTE